MSALPRGARPADPGLLERLVDGVCASAGLTLVGISGGEPFAQAEAVADLVAAVRARRDMSVLCYSGFTLEHLRRSPAAGRLLGLLDILIDGPYLPLVIQEAAGIPLDPSFAAQKEIMLRCKGIFYGCKDGAEARRLNRLLINAGMIRGL